MTLLLELVSRLDQNYSDVLQFSEIIFKRLETVSVLNILLNAIFDKFPYHIFISPIFFLISISHFIYLYIKKITD